MQDSEQDYPVRKARRRARDEDNDEQDDWLPVSSLPAKGLLYALGIGIGGGLLTAVIGVIITLANSSTFQEAATLQEKMPFNTATTIAGLNCLSYFLALLICFAAGYIVGKVAVLRSFGFYAGALAGAIAYLGGILTQYIPNYPGHIASTSSTGAVAGGVLFLIVLLIIYAAIGGLMGLWGVWTTTRHHPYYLAKRAQEDLEAE
jgi:hypothetical protein